MDGVASDDTALRHGTDFSGSNPQFYTVRSTHVYVASSFFTLFYICGMMAYTVVGGVCRIQRATTRRSAEVHDLCICSVTAVVKLCASTPPPSHAY